MSENEQVDRQDEAPDGRAASPEPVTPDEPTGPVAVEDLSPDDTEGAPADADLAGPDQEPEPAAGEGGAPDWEALAAEEPRSKAQLLADLAVAEAARDEYLDDLRRARAEFENYRRRMLKETAQMRVQGIAELTTKLLDVLDDFDRTIDAAEWSEDQGLKKGVELVYGKLIDVLKSVGLARIDDIEEPFDPERHEAVQQVPAEEPTDHPVVAEVLRPGYQLDGRVLRAAMVVVRQ